MTTISSGKIPMVSQTASASDKQMQLPIRPKLVAGVQPVWHSQNCLVFVGAAHTVTMRGKSVSTVLPRLLPLLDGTQTLGELAARMSGVSRRGLEQVLMLLFMRGLLAGEVEDCVDELRDELERDKRWRPVLDAYERYLDVTRANRSATAVLASMRRARLLLISDSEHALTTLQSLKELGLGGATLLSPRVEWIERAQALADSDFRIDTCRQDLDAAPPANARDYTVCVFISAQPAVEHALALEQALEGLRLFYAVLGEKELRIGPSTEVPVSACLHCAQASGIFVSDDSLSYDPLTLELGAERVAHKILQLITRLIANDSIERSETLDTDTMLFKARPVLRQFDCPHCSPLSVAWADRLGLDLGGDHLAPLPWLYHQQSQHAAHQMAPKGHQAHYLRQHKEASAGAFKRYQSKKRMPLSAAPDRSEMFARVGGMLQLAVGRRVVEVAPGVNVALRFTPSGGGMASQNVYVLSYEEETRGFYYFDPNGYWQQLSTEAPELAELGLSGGDDLRARFALVLTSAHARLESKYGLTAYRYALYDAGALIASLQALAPQHGFTLHTTGHFEDSAVAALYGALETNEFATAIAVLAECPVTHDFTPF